MATKLKILYQKLDRLAEEFETQFDQVLKALGKDMTGVVAEFDIRSGVIARTMENMKKVERMQGELLRSLDDAGYTELTKDYIAAYDKLFLEMGEGLKELGMEGFNVLDLETLIASKATDYAQFEGLASEAVSRITQQVSRNAVGGGLFKDAVASIEATLGANFKQYSNTYAKTASHNFAAKMTEIKVKEEGIERMMYEGSLQTNSRDCCRAWQGKIFTVEEIEGFTNGMFSDGSPQLPTGNCLTDRGGWNCNHFWAPIPNE